MSIEEIRKNAPDGATHYKIYPSFKEKDKVVYFKYAKNVLVMFINSFSYTVVDSRTCIDIKPLN